MRHYLLSNIRKRQHTFWWASVATNKDPLHVTNAYLPSLNILGPLWHGIAGKGYSNAIYTFGMVPKERYPKTKDIKRIRESEVKYFGTIGRGEKKKEVTV